MDKEEILQNDIIRVLRHYFNDKPCKEWTTGFQRQCAKDVINLVRQDIDIDNNDLKAENKKLHEETEMLQKCRMGRLASNNKADEGSN